MEKLKKNICILIFLSIICLLFSQCYAADEYIKSDFTIDGTATVPPAADKVINNVWGTVKLILQVLSVTAVIVAGVRYMFTSSAGKANIKQQSLGLILGAIIVFASTEFVNFVVKIVKDTTN